MLDYFRNKNVLITGGLGFLGSNIAHRLVAMNANVIIIDNLDAIGSGTDIGMVVNAFNKYVVDTKVPIIAFSKNEMSGYPGIEYYKG